MRNQPCISKRQIGSAFSQTRLAFKVWMSLLIFVPCLPVGAWNHVGHRTVAELAWRQISAKQRQGATELLKHHPHYQEMLARDIPKGVNKDEWVFLSGAVWPDWVRPAKAGQPKRPDSITKYDVYPHALGHPFLRAGDTNQSLVEHFFVAKPDAEMVLSNCLVTLRDGSLSDHDRAVSLCWVMHLMGDLHQPLHAANRVTPEKPRGEGLGGDQIVMDPRAGKGERRTNLHVFWDSLPGARNGYDPITKLADQLTILNPTSLADYREHTTIPAWVHESFLAAVNFAYEADHVRCAAAEDLKSGRISESEIPTLSSQYIAGAREIANDRLALAGRRLADELKKIW